ncbi:MAG: flagellar FliJ family protein [Phycisphaerales bacterium]
MAKFVFRLEAVLRARLAEERARQLALATVERERAAIEEEIRGHQVAIATERAEMRERLSPGAPVQLRAVRLQAHAALHAVARAQQATLRLAGVYQRIDVARRDLLKATTRRKAVERLRERRFEEWAQERKRAETAALDELAVMRAALEETWT